jgi:hypothetical protein
MILKDFDSVDAALNMKVKGFFDKFWDIQFKAEDEFEKLKQSKSGIHATQNESKSAMNMARLGIKAYDVAAAKFFNVYGKDTKDQDAVNVFLNAKKGMLNLYGLYVKQRMEESYQARDRTNDPKFDKFANDWYKKSLNNIKNKTILRYEYKYNEKIGGLPSSPDKLMSFMKSEGFKKF